MKRFEENVKFVFKATFKHLRNQFLKSKHCASFTETIDNEFYEYYFGELSVALNTKLCEFRDPLNHANHHKTLTHEYLRLVLRSPLFKSAFLDFLSSGQLKSDYQRTIPNKILKVLKRFDYYTDPSSSDQQNTAAHQVRKYFRVNRQCKLPWTEVEVNGAVDCLKQACK